MAKAQLYAGVGMPVFSTPEELEEMLDFADIGGVYDSPGAAASNTTALQSFLSSRNASPGIAISFTGQRLTVSYNEKRQPGVAYFDLSSGPISYTPADKNNGSLTLTGLPGAKLIGQSAQTPTTPLLEVMRPLGGVQAYELSNLTIENGLGSGLKFYGDTATTTGPGSRSSLVNLRIAYCGTSLGSAPAIDYDGWSDLDTAVYGLLIAEADGGFLHNCTVSNIAGHGIIAKRWHEGLCHANARECTGAGLKGERIESTSLTFRAESNDGWGLHVRDTGNERRAASETIGGSMGQSPNAWDVWFEANNDRGATGAATSGSGYRYTQMRIDGSSRLTIGGHSGWAAGKVSIAEPSRRCCRIVEEDFIDPSPGDAFATLVYDANTDGFRPMDGSGDNFTAAWTDPADRPTLVESGDTGNRVATLTIPAGCYDTATEDAYWQPVPASVSVPDSVVGDMWMWTMEIEGDGDAVAYCVGREDLASPAPRMPAYLGSMSMSGLASRTFALFSQASRKFSGRVSMDASIQMVLTMYLYFAGMEDTGGSGATYPETQSTLTIRSLKLYRIRE